MRVLFPDEGSAFDQHAAEQRGPEFYVGAVAHARVVSDHHAGPHFGADPEFGAAAHLGMGREFGARADLRPFADHGIFLDRGVLAHIHPPPQDGALADSRVSADRYAVADHRVRPYRGTRVDLGAGMYAGRGVNVLVGQRMVHKP